MNAAIASEDPMKMKRPLETGWNGRMPIRNSKRRNKLNGSVAVSLPAVHSTTSSDAVPRANPAPRRRSRVSSFFQPRSFYEYIWICLNQGYGTRQWKASPPMPSDSKNDGAWFVQKAKDLLNGVVGNWEQGVDLGTLSPTLSLELVASPYDRELIAMVRSKVDPLLHRLVVQQPEFHLR
jgi:hypothetical protein